MQISFRIEVVNIRNTNSLGFSGLISIRQLISRKPIWDFGCLYFPYQFKIIHVREFFITLAVEGVIDQYWTVLFLANASM